MCIRDRPDLTLEELSGSLFTEFQINVAPQTVSHHLNGLCYTLKECRVELDTVNSQVNKAKRLSWANDYLQLVSDGYIPMFQDETNFNQHIRRSRGRARKGERAVCNLPATRGRNIHCVASISPLDLISFSNHLGSLKAPDFGEYLKLIADGLERRLIGKAVINIDNAPWHANAETEWNKIMNSFNRDGRTRDWKLLRLAPYSFSCSPIERFWSAFKAGVKAEFQERREEILYRELTAGETFTSRRTRILREVALHQSAQHSDVHKLQAYFQKVQLIIVKASCGEDVPVGV